jgi:hypothetical protein
MGKDLCEAYPNHAAARLALSNVMLQQSFLSLSAPEFIAKMRACIDIRRSVLARQPDSPKVLWALAHGLLGLAESLPPASAEPLIAEAISLTTRCGELEPLERDWPATLAIAQHEMARALAEADPRSAEFFALQAGEILDRVRDACAASGTDPLQVDSIARHRAGTFLVVARASLARNDHAGALLAADLARDLAERSVAADTTNLVRQRDLARTLTESARLRMLIANRESQPGPHLDQARTLIDRACRALSLFKPGTAAPWEITRDWNAALDIAQSIDDALYQPAPPD